MTPSVGPFRMSVEIAERLAALGLTVLRIDQSGKGESPLRPGLSPADAALLDFDEAFHYLEQSGVRRVLLIGLCSGAFDALRIAADRASVSGLVMLDGYVRRTSRWYWHDTLGRGLRLLERGPLGALRRLAGKRDYVSPEPPETVLADNRDLKLMDQRPLYGVVLERGLKMLSIFSSGFYPYNHDGQLTRFLAPDIDTHGLREVYFPEADHTYTLILHRQRLVETIADWVASEFD